MSDRIAEENLEIVRRSFLDQDWEDVIARSTLFAIRLTRGRNESARLAEDYAVEAAERFLRGDRRLLTPLAGAPPERVRAIVFMFLCGVIRSLVSHERSDGRADADDFGHDPPNPQRWHGMHDLFPAGSLEHDVLQAMLESDFDIPPRDIHALLTSRMPGEYAELSVQDVYTARRRVRERLRARLEAEEKALSFDVAEPDAFMHDRMVRSALPVREPLEDEVWSASTEQVWTRIDAPSILQRIRMWLYGASGLR